MISDKIKKMYLSNDENIFIVACSILFLIVPLPTIVLVTLVLLSNEKNSKKSWFFLFVLLAFYMGIINATKTPDADQYSYWFAFLNVPKQGFIGSLSNIYGDLYSENVGKEFMFGFLNYIGYYITFGNYQVYIFGFIVLMYMFTYAAIYKFYSVVNNRSFVIVAAVFFITFFTQYFNLTLQLQRQFLASAIMLYALAVRAADGKNLWWLGFLSVFTHTSMGLFLPLLFIKPLTKKLSITGIAVLAGVSVLFFAFSTQIGGLLGGSSSPLSYGFNRMAMGESNVDDTTGESLFVTYLLTIAIMAMVIFLLFKYRKVEKSPIYFTYYTIIILLIFVLTMYSQPLTQYRYFMASYIFFPLVIPNLFQKPTLINTLCLSAITLFFFLRFFLTFENIIWEYAPVQDIMFKNFFSLLLNKYY